MVMYEQPAEEVSVHGVPYIRIDASDARRSAMFQEILAADDREGGALRGAYADAAHRHGQWVVAVPVVTRSQLVRALLGFPWHPVVPQMAVRRFAVPQRVDFAPDAEAVLPGRVKPGWWRLVAGRWEVEWTD